MTVKGAGTVLIWFLQADYATANTTPADARPLRVRPGVNLEGDVEEVDSELFKRFRCPRLAWITQPEVVFTAPHPIQQLQVPFFAICNFFRAIHG